MPTKQTTTTPAAGTPKHTEGELEVLGMSDGSYHLMGDKKNGSGQSEFVAAVMGGDTYKKHANANKLAKCWNMHQAFIEAVKMELWALDNGEYEAQKQGKPRHIERIGILQKLLKQAAEQK